VIWAGVPPVDSTKAFMASMCSWMPWVWVFGSSAGIREGPHWRTRSGTHLERERGPDCQLGNECNDASHQHSRRWTGVLACP
jgi:hypothetical protein